MRFLMLLYADEKVGAAMPPDEMAKATAAMMQLIGQAQAVQAAVLRGATPAQVALAWLLRDRHVIAIPKTSSVAHVGENRAATSLTLSTQTMARIDEAFPPPSRATRLAVI